MYDFINTSTKEIKQWIIKSNKQEKLSDYVQKMYESQNKNADNMETQHQAIFEKVEDNRKCLGEVMTRIDWIKEGMTMNMENQVRTINNQGIVIEKQETIEANQKEIKSLLETIKGNQLKMDKEYKKEAEIKQEITEKPQN
jgi:elongation factor P hydroxylase